jgi:hypothetical protein
MPATSRIQDSLRKFDRCNQEASENEKHRNEQGLAKEFQLFLRRVATDRGVDWGAARTAALTDNPARKAPTIPGKLMRSASTPATTMMPSMATK